MKMLPVYVGQLADIRYGAVYATITEAVKEVCRALQPGQVMVFINLPESPTGKYWIAGAIGPAANTKWNLIFTNSSDAEKHMETIQARGFSKKELVCRELKIHTKGPDVIDIKTEEHFICERELGQLKAAMNKGIVADNSSAIMQLTFEEGSFLTSEKFAIVDIQAHPLHTLEDPIKVLEDLATQRKLLVEMAAVDPDTQPNKWSKLQKQVAALIQRNHENPNGQT